MSGVMYREWRVRGDLGPAFSVCRTQVAFTASWLRSRSEAEDESHESHPHRRPTVARRDVGLSDDVTTAGLCSDFTAVSKLPLVHCPVAASKYDTGSATGCKRQPS